MVQTHLTAKCLMSTQDQHTRSIYRKVKPFSFSPVCDNQLCFLLTSVSVCLDQYADLATKSEIDHDWTRDTVEIDVYSLVYVQTIICGKKSKYKKNLYFCCETVIFFVAFLFFCCFYIVPPVLVSSVSVFSWQAFIEIILNVAFCMLNYSGFRLTSCFARTFT